MSKTEEHVHVRAWRRSRENLKLLSVLLRESMTELLDRLVREEAKRKNIDLREDG